MESVELLNPDLMVVIAGITVSVFFVPYIITVGVRSFFRWMD